MIFAVTNICTAFTVYHHHSKYAAKHHLKRWTIFQFAFRASACDAFAQCPVYGSIAYTECVAKQLTISTPLGVAAIPSGYSDCGDSWMVSN